MRSVHLLVVAIGFLVVAWAGNAATLVYYEFGYGFNDPIDHLALLGDMMSLAPSDVVVQFFGPEFFLGINLAMLATTVTLLVAMAVPLGRRWRLLVLAVPLAAMALLVAPIGLSVFLLSLSAGHDGEWLAEGWPTLEVAGFWAVVVVGYGTKLLLGEESVGVWARRNGRRLQTWADEDKSSASAY